MDFEICTEDSPFSHEYSSFHGFREKRNLSLKLPLFRGSNAKLACNRQQISSTLGWIMNKEYLSERNQMSLKNGDLQQMQGEVLGLLDTNLSTSHFHFPNKWACSPFPTAYSLPGHWGPKADPWHHRAQDLNPGCDASPSLGTRSLATGNLETHSHLIPYYWT